MTTSRRTLLYGAGALLGGSTFIAPKTAQANDGTEYFYDPLGRLIRVELSDGTIVLYEYDAAGNRRMIIHGDDSPFNQTLQITGTGPVNLRTIADLAGYAGASNATITFQVGSTVTISGAPGGGAGIDTGTWPAGFTIALTLQVSGKVYGGGGNGASAGGNGNAGGDALYCRENLTLTVNSGGQIKAGGGGGGSGGGWLIGEAGAEEVYYGGGGGGGFPNGLGGTGGPGGTGSNGTSSGGGSGGSSGAVGARTCGAGGAGGGAAATGSTGADATGTEGCNAQGICRTKTAPGSGGVAGYAVRKNGKTVNVTNNGTISGTVG